MFSKAGNPNENQNGESNRYSGRNNRTKIGPKTLTGNPGMMLWWKNRPPGPDSEPVRPEVCGVVGSVGRQCKPQPLRLPAADAAADNLAN